MTVDELIARLRELPGDLDLRPVTFARLTKNPHGEKDWTTYRIREVSFEPMAIWLTGDKEK